MFDYHQSIYNHHKSIYKSIYNYHKTPINPSIITIKSLKFIYNYHKIPINPSIISQYQMVFSTISNNAPGAAAASLAAFATCPPAPGTEAEAAENGWTR